MCYLQYENGIEEVDDTDGEHEAVGVEEAESCDEISYCDVSRHVCQPQNHLYHNNPVVKV